VTSDTEAPAPARTIAASSRSGCGSATPRSRNSRAPAAGCVGSGPIQAPAINDGLSTNTTVSTAPGATPQQRRPARLIADEVVDRCSLMVIVMGTRVPSGPVMTHR
jgi:hypothetical protein